MLCLGLAGNVLRFLYIAWLSDPWWVLPFEFVQGVTHAAVWAACCSYIAHGAPPGLRSSAQGVLQGAFTRYLLSTVTNHTSIIFTILITNDQSCWS